MIDLQCKMAILLSQLIYDLHVQCILRFHIDLLCFQAYYYFAIVEDSILRFVWTLHVSLGEGILFEQREALTTILASFEVFR